LIESKEETISHECSSAPSLGKFSHTPQVPVKNLGVASGIHIPRGDYDNNDAFLTTQEDDEEPYPTSDSSSSVTSSPHEVNTILSALSPVGKFIKVHIKEPSNKMKDMPPTLSLLRSPATR
jgi:hypothetical protein